MSTPMRIVSLLPGVTETLFGLGLGDRVVAVSHECDYPAEVASLPKVTVCYIDAAASSPAIDEQVRRALADGQALYRIDVQRLAELAPELIVTQAQCDVCAVQHADVVAAVNQSSLANTHVLALNPQSLEDIFVDIVRIGRAAGCIDRAITYVDGLKSRLAEVRGQIIASRERQPRAVCIEWIEPLMLAGNWVPEMIELAGGECGLARPGQPSRYHDWPAIAEYDPDVIIVCPCGFDLHRTIREMESLTRLPGWRDLTAVRENRVFPMDGNAYLNRAGPRMVDAVEMMATLFQMTPPERPLSQL